MISENNDKECLEKYIPSELMPIVVLTVGALVSEVNEWCREHETTATFLGMYQGDPVWCIIDDDERVMFKLRWA